VQSDRLDQAALDAGVDVERGRLGNRPVLSVQHRVDLRQGEPLHGDHDFDEVAGFSLQERQAIEAADFPEGCGIGPLVGAQHLEPAGEIPGVMQLTVEAAMGAEEGSTHLGDQLLRRVGVISEPLAQLTIASRQMR
jgi:hypothetical protein